MFLRADIQSVLDGTATFKHVATLNSPYSFEIRPSGFKRGEPNYRVLVERTAFALKAAVVPDYLAVAVVAAIVSGARNNPARVERLRQSLEDAGWEPEIRLTPEGFRLAAERLNAGSLDDEELTAAGAAVAVAVSEFVLDQLIVTKPYGEVRPAVERSLSDAADAEPWLYDPSERDRATRVHRALENWLIIKLQEVGLRPLDAAGEPYFDVAWKSGSSFFVCEVKSTRNSEDHQIRLGLGQVLHYGGMLRRAGAGDVVLTLLVEQEPKDQLWGEICARAGVLLFWPDIWDETETQIGVGEQR